MKYIAEINIMPHTELLDPQGKTVANNMKNIGVYGIEDVRIGKHIVLKLEAQDEKRSTTKGASSLRKATCQCNHGNLYLRHTQRN